MKLRPFSVLLLCLPIACAAPRERSAPLAPAPVELLTYRASVATVPAGAADLRLCVRVPEAAADLRLLRASALVGNAAFEVPLEGGRTAPDGSPRARGAPADVSWTLVEEGGVRFRELVLATHGKPVELALRLARPAGVPGGNDDLERVLARGTRLTADGRPVAGLVTRLERVR